jgi:hypothetical protein
MFGHNKVTHQAVIGWCCPEKSRYRKYVVRSSITGTQEVCVDGAVGSAEYHLVSDWKEINETSKRNHRRRNLKPTLPDGGLQWQG